MQLNIDLGYTEVDSGKRVKEAQAKQDAKNYEPTWDEVWLTGWTTHTGTFKKPILKTKLTLLDKQRLLDVKTAIENGELGTEVESLKKFSKSHALNLNKRLIEIRRESIAVEMVKNKPDNYHLITTLEGLEKVVRTLRNEDLIALDTETTGVEYFDTTVGMSISFDKADYHVYIPYKHITDVTQLSRETVMEAMKPELERKGLKLVLHNSKFDAHMLKKDGIEIRENIYFDTMIAMHVLNENEPSFALKKLANKYGKFFGYTDDSMTFEELFGKDPQAFREADLMLAAIYACKDTHLTLLFYKWQMSMFEKQPKLKSVYFDMEQQNTYVALEMESNGFEIDFNFATQYQQELQKQVKQLEQTLIDQWGDINVNSPKQLQELFYDKLGYEDVSKKRSVDAKTIKALSAKHPEVKTLLEYRDVNKLLSTYIEPLPQMVQKDGISKTGVAVKGDNRLHGNFMQTGTVTGRWASKAPNLQNLPPKARGLIVAPAGKLMIGIDYSQIEPRTLASMSGDTGLQEPYVKGIDLYSTLASRIFKLPYEACLESDDKTWREKGMPKHPRKMMKVGLLAVMYGIAVPSLADSLGISRDEAQQFMDDFYSTYPVMSAWMDQQVKFADANGYVETANGRKRRFAGHKEVAKQYNASAAKIKDFLGYLPANIWDRSLELPYKLKQQFGNVKRDYARVERMSVNAVIQGSAAEVLKKAMIAVYEHLKQKDGWRLLATIHDELLFEIPETATPEEINELAEIMLSTTKLSIPIKCDVEVMTRWGSGIPLQEWIEKGCGRNAFN